MLGIQVRNVDLQMGTFVFFAEKSDVLLDQFRINIVETNPLQDVLRFIGEYHGDASELLYGP